MYKRRKTSKDVDLSKSLKSKESKSISSSKGTTRSQLKSTVKSAHAEEIVFEAGDTQEPENQGQDMGNTNEQPNVKAAPNHDMLLLLVQNKLSNLERDVIFKLGVALQMFTKRIIILKWVEDLQLGVKICQKKLCITKSNPFRFDISNITLYTAYSNPQGIIFVDKYNKNRLMRSDELYKFSDGMLTSVRTVLHDIASNLRMDYLPQRRWSNLDRQRSRIMIKAIDKLLLERRLMRSLEKFLGGRDYGEDFRLLERTI
nr:hypothetical protein [Tanacetum cinerariifolium]